MTHQDLFYITPADLQRVATLDGFRPLHRKTNHFTIKRIVVKLRQGKTLENIYWQTNYRLRYFVQAIFDNMPYYIFREGQAILVDLPRSIPVDSRA
jgi:hypothetical protein